MNIVRFEPWSLLQTELNRLNRMLGRQFFQDEDNSMVETSQWVPLVDIKEKSDRFILRADIPGIDPKDIQVTMENSTLSIKGERKEEHTEEGGEEGREYTRTERIMGTFYRRFALPDTVDPDHITAKGKHGVLELTIPKREKAQPRKIDIKIS